MNKDGPKLTKPYLQKIFKIFDVLSIVAKKIILILPFGWYSFYGGFLVLKQPFFETSFKLNVFLARTMFILFISPSSISF
jgi:hypothetical protein